MNKSCFVLSFIALLMMLSACEKNPTPKTNPQVQTLEVSEITSGSAVAKGEVLSDGNSPVSLRGFVWGLQPGPTINDSKVEAGSGKGMFSATLTNLNPGTVYHVRAFAINVRGTSYGDDLFFQTTAGIPALVTSNPTSVTAVSARVSGEVVQDGGAAVTARGICWNTSGSPTVSDQKVISGSGVGAFIADISKLKYSTKVYLRSFATNSAGTGYGNQVELTTLSPIPAAGLTGWWPFNGNANDESGNGRNGVIAGAIATADRFDITQAAYSFNGTSDQIAVAHVPAFNFASSNIFSVSYWFKAQSLSGSFPSVILEKQSGLGNNQIGWNSLIEPNFKVNFYVHNGVGGLTACDYGSVQTNQWYHVVQVWNNGTASIYLNGTLAGTNSFSDVVGDNSESLLMGMNDFGAPGFNGLIDDVAIWNRALTTDEVLKVYNGSGF